MAPGMQATIGVLALAIVVSLEITPAVAQTPSAAPGDLTFSGSLRTRVELWNWFDAEANDDYLFSGSQLRLTFGQSRTRYRWQVDLAAPLLFGLPDDAIATGAQGQLGLGATYFSANNSGRNDAMLFAKQAFIRFIDVGGIAGQSLTVGRVEVVEGAEVVSKNATVATLTRDRIAQRLVGPFGFSHVGRSADGILYAIERPRLNVTAFAGRPTAGIFQVDGWGELDVNVYYGAVAGQLTRRPAAWRLFGLGYSDYRNNVIKTDNRPLVTRRADTGRIDLMTVGGHYVAAIATRAGSIDLVAWGAGQTGSWGALSHRAWAFAGEIGWQPANPPAWQPWIRGGYNVGSGDNDPADASHGTFFQVLPTPRIYARFPFFNMMNTRDAFVEARLKPSRRVALRADVHLLRLSSAADLWYQGGGAFQPATFGFAGRPSNGTSSLATLYDASADVTVNPRTAVGLYYGRASGGRVTRAIYPRGNDADFGFVELTLRF